MGKARVWHELTRDILGFTTSPTPNQQTTRHRRPIRCPSPSKGVAGGDHRSPFPLSAWDLTSQSTRLLPCGQGKPHWHLSTLAWIMTLPSSPSSRSFVRVGRVLVPLWIAGTIVDAQNICTSSTNTFTVKVNLFHGELGRVPRTSWNLTTISLAHSGYFLSCSPPGYFTFEECGDAIMPTLGLEVGQTYTFHQGDRTNYYHPMGFAYYPDGAHDGKPELEPGVSGSGDGTISAAQTQNATLTCADTATCPAPMYFMGDTYLGSYSNIPDVTNRTVGITDFGLDLYEPKFFHPLIDWINYGNFSVHLNFDDDTYTKDIFYFCHVSELRVGTCTLDRTSIDSHFFASIGPLQIHQFMSGRIKLLQNGLPLSEADDPPINYEYETPSEFDAECGTYGLEAFQLPNSQCPATFVCGADDQDQLIRNSAPCYDAFNCAMMVGMTSGASSDSEVALFIHHMIPHHAVRQLRWDCVRIAALAHFLVSFSLRLSICFVPAECCEYGKTFSSFFWRELRRLDGRRQHRVCDGGPDAGRCERSEPPDSSHARHIGAALPTGHRRLRRERHFLAAGGVGECHTGSSSGEHHAGADLRWLQGVRVVVPLWTAWIGSGACNVAPCCLAAKGDALSTVAITILLNIHVEFVRLPYQARAKVFVQS